MNATDMTPQRMWFFGSQALSSQANNLVVDSSGVIYVVGVTYDYNFTIGTTFVSGSQPDAYGVSYLIMRLDPASNFTNVVCVSNPADVNGNNMGDLRAVVLDSSDKLIVAGAVTFPNMTIEGTTDQLITTSTDTSGSFGEMFLMKFSSATLQLSY